MFVDVKQELTFDIDWRGAPVDILVNEDGIARIPGIREIPALNLEDEFARAGEVQLEAVGRLPAAVPRTVKRAELERLVSAHPGAEPDEHDE